FRGDPAGGVDVNCLVAAKPNYPSRSAANRAIFLGGDCSHRHQHLVSIARFLPASSRSQFDRTPAGGRRRRLVLSIKSNFAGEFAVHLPAVDDSIWKLALVAAVFGNNRRHRGALARTGSRVATK